MNNSQNSVISLVDQALTSEGLPTYSELLALHGLLDTGPAPLDDAEAVDSAISDLLAN